MKMKLKMKTKNHQFRGRKTRMKINLMNIINK